MNNSRRRSGRLLAIVLALLAPSVALAQPCQHGASIFKTCESVKRTCASNVDCDDGLECTNDVCDPAIDNKTNCLISLAHADTCGDTTKITEAFDVQDIGGDNVRVPAVGSLPIDALFGNAVCCAGPTLPCFVGPAGSLFVIPAANTGCGNLPLPGAATRGLVQFRQNTYVVQANDPNPLPDQGNVKVQDLCNAGASGCSTALNTVQFTASTDLVSGCTNLPVPDSTPCTDNDGNACTTAGCNGQGACDQNHIVKQCPTDACNTGQCNTTSGLCVPQPDSSPCPDTDQNPCTVAGCEAGGTEIGTCIQTHILPDSTPCPDTGNECAAAGCNGQGVCDQNHVLAPDSTPCTDTGNECAAAGCNGQGVCDQNHLPVQASTPCTDTDQNPCTVAGCDGLGTCDQNHVLPDSTPCPDTGNECAAAGCDGHGNCDQNHVLAPDSTPCTDADGNACTTAGCDGLGTCAQDHQEVTCLNPLCQQCEPASGQCVPSTPLPPECVLDHFQCYENHRQPINVFNVSLVDQFGASTVEVKEARRFCLPANKNDEDPTAPGDPEHLTFYTIKQTTPRFTRIRGVTVTNQFGSIVVDVTKPDRLLVPTAKSLTSTPPPLANPIDHYKCYKVRGAKFRRSSINIKDQFGQVTIDIKKPEFLCAPVNKNGEGVVDDVTHLMCYLTRLTSHTPINNRPPAIFTTNQFVSDTFTIFGPRELCVPSTKTLPPS